MFLSLLSGSHKGRVMKVEREGVIGRDPAVEYSIDDPTVSRRHAELIRSAEGWRLRDLGSANGTEINGARLIGDKALREGDVIGVGRVTMVYNTQLAGTVRGSGPIGVEQTLPPDEMLQPGPELVSAMLAGLRAEHRDAESQAAAALAAMIRMIPGAVRASVVDWRAGKLLARAPEGAEVSRSTLFRALSALKTEPRGVSVWTIEECRRLAQSLALAEVAPFVAVSVDHQVGLLLEGMAADETRPDVGLSLAQLADATLLLKIPVAAIRAEVAAGSRKMRDSDLRLAQRIQQKLLTPPPESIDGFELALSYTPAMMVGGDFFHIEKRGVDELAVLIGDVSGKGVSGAMYMAYLVADLRHQLRTNAGPAELLENLQRSLTPVLESGMFVTVAAVFVNTRSGMCRVGLAGHSAPVLRTAARKVIEMGLDPGSPIGADMDLAVREQRLQLAPGDCLVLTTDGVDEGENSAGEAYGKSRRDQVLLACDSAAEINQALRKSLLEFVGRDRSTDDLTIICLGRVRG
ncbi:MAG TPA: SpoIIE family protein phosphatase [Xanthomonadales bacterium]|nr:SpoIIE family protein phosphatase [Xanthomonadales bacterium]